MASLSISTAWNETAEFVKREGGALFIIALAFMALPSVALQALAPGAVAPGQAPEPRLWVVLLLPVVMVLSIVGSLAISALALGRENIVGNAIAHGFRRFLPLLGASLLVGLAVVIVLVPLILASGIDMSELAAPTPAVAGKLLLFMVIFALIVLFVWVRIMLVTPVAAAEKLGPVAIIRRSWALTRGHMWKLVALVLLLAIAVLVIGYVVSLVVGIPVALIDGPPRPGSLGALLILLAGGVVNAGFAVIFTTMVARIYAQLIAGETTGN